MTRLTSPNPHTSDILFRHSDKSFFQVLCLSANSCLLQQPFLLTNSSVMDSSHSSFPPQSPNNWGRRQSSNEGGQLSWVIKFSAPVCLSFLPILRLICVHFKRKKKCYQPQPIWAPKLGSVGKWTASAPAQNSLMPKLQAVVWRVQIFLW